MNTPRFHGAVLLALLLVGVATAAPQSKPPSANAARAVRAAPLNCDDPGVAVPQRNPAVAAQQMQALIVAAQANSRNIDVAKALAQAAQADWRQAVAAFNPQIAATLDVGGNAFRDSNGQQSTSAQASAGVQVQKNLWDNGLATQMEKWRGAMLHVAQAQVLSQQDQVALAAVSLAIERNRYIEQSEIYERLVSKMGCLVSTLEHIVNADKGRASEMVQARKSQAQATLTLTQLKQQRSIIEMKLRDLVGEGVAFPANLDATLLPLPGVEELIARARNAPDMQAIRAQVQAAGYMTEVQRAATGPTVSAGGSLAQSIAAAGGGAGTTTRSQVGVNVRLSMPLFNEGAKAAVDAASQREIAAQRQYEAMDQSKQLRVRELHVTALNAEQRAAQSMEIAKLSDNVRRATWVQWQQLGRRSLFDLMSSESDYYSTQAAAVNARHDAQALSAMLMALANAWNKGQIQH